MKPGNLSDDFLDKMTDRKPGWKKENPFNVPDSYFESLSENIVKKIEALPDLQKLNKENPFRVPEGYFEAMPAMIQEKIIEGKKKKNIFGEWGFSTLRPVNILALAVIIIMLIIGIQYLLKPSMLPTDEKTITLEELQNSPYVAELDEATIIEELEQQNKNTNTTEDNSIEQYLIDNNIDVAQIENHL